MGGFILSFDIDANVLTEYMLLVRNHVTIVIEDGNANQDAKEFDDGWHVCSYAPMRARGTAYGIQWVIVSGNTTSIALSPL